MSFQFTKPRSAPNSITFQVMLVVEIADDIDGVAFSSAANLRGSGPTFTKVTASGARPRRPWRRPATSPREAVARRICRSCDRQIPLAARRRHSS